MKTRPPSSQRGVTLVEPCTVLVVIVVIVGVAVPGMQSLLDARRLEGIATQLAGDIRFVRSAAVARNEPLRLSLHATATGGCYVVHSGNANQCRCIATGPAQCTGDAREIKTVTIAAADRIALQANVASMLFDPLHGTSTPAGTWRVTDRHERAIHHVVNVMGRVRSCSPRAAATGYRAC